MGKKAAVLLTAGALAIGGAVANAISSDGTEAAHVAKIVDGDTFDVTRDGQTVRVRLLNVDTPETVDPNRPPECGGVQATEWLKQRLPIGTTVDLAYDVERHDRYGRELAWITAPDGGVVNLEIARRGLGEAMTVAPNNTHFAEVQAAQEEARAAQTGLFDPVMECVLPAKVTQQITTLGQAAAGATSAEDADLAAALAGSAAVYTALSHAKDTVDGRMLGTEAVARLRGKLDKAHAQAEQTKTDLAARAREQEEQRQEAERAAAQEAAQREADARRAAEPTQNWAPDPVTKEPTAPRVEPESERTPDEPAVEDPPAARDTDIDRDSDGDSRDDPDSDSSPDSGSNNPPGYTGPRCYEPGGKVWHPC